jgi:hypothetical protein
MPQRDHLIFVNYRGSDEIWATEYVYEKMRAAFGQESVFKAGNVLNPGDVYSPILLKKAVSCPVMLACVGPDWLDAQGPDGRRRLDAKDDWVRREIAASIRAGNRVVPLLLGDQQTVAIPKPSDLPPDARTLFGRQAARLIPGGGLDLTVPLLIDRLAEVEPELAARRAAVRSGGTVGPTKPPTAATGAGADGSGAFAGATFGKVGAVVAHQVVDTLNINLDGPATEDR